MPCETIYDDDGRTIGFACRRGGRTRRCSSCRAATATQLCDYPLANGKTCDRPLCRRCAVKQPGRDMDFCPPHARLAAPDGSST